MENQNEKYSFVRRNKCCADITRYTQDVIRANGYKIKTVELCTEDGYFITLFRIQPDKNLNDTRRVPVLLVHGLTQSAAEFTIYKHQLGYFLADCGLDVWIANCRGTTFSRKHRHLSDESSEYWNYSFHEIGYYDLPTFIDHILKETGKSNLCYIGVSQGCTVLSVLGCTRPEYNKKIGVACFLCPALKFENTKLSFMKIFFHYAAPILKIANDYLHVPIHGDTLSYWLRVYTHETSKYRIGRYLNSVIWSYYSGYNSEVPKNWEDLSQIAKTSPNTISLKQVVHFSQIIKANRFTMYDYGPEKNIDVYGKTVPPPYDISKITIPIGLFYSQNDSCNAQEDMEDISNQLGNCVYEYIVEDKNFSHFDFVYHKDAKRLLYIHIFDFMKKFLPEDYDITMN